MVRKIIKKTEKIKLKVNKAVNDVKKTEEALTSSVSSASGINPNDPRMKAAMVTTRTVINAQKNVVKTAALVGALPAVAVVSKIHNAKSKHTLDKHAFDDIDVQKIVLSKPTKPRQELIEKLKDKKINGASIVSDLTVNDLLVKHKLAKQYSKPQKRYKAKYEEKDFIPLKATPKQIKQIKKDVRFENIIQERGTNDVLKVGVRVFNRGKVNYVNRSVCGTPIKRAISKYKVENRLYRNIIKAQNQYRAAKEVVVPKSVEQLKKALIKNYRSIINTYRPSLLRRYSRFLKRTSIRMIKQTTKESIKSVKSIVSSTTSSAFKNADTSGEAINGAIQTAKHIQTASKITISTAKTSYKFAKAGVKTGAKTVRAVRHPIRTTRMMKKKSVNRIKNAINNFKKAVAVLHKITNPFTIAAAGIFFIIILLSNLLTLTAGLIDEVEEFGYDANSKILTDTALAITKKDAELKKIITDMKNKSTEESTFEKLMNLVKIDEGKHKTEVDVDIVTGDYNFGIHTTPWSIGTYVDDSYDGEIKPEYNVPGDVWNQKTIHDWEVNSDYAMISDLKAYYDFMGLYVNDMTDEELEKFVVKDCEDLDYIWKVNNQVDQKIEHYLSEKIKINVPIYEKREVKQNTDIKKGVWTIFEGDSHYNYTGFYSYLIPIQFVYDFETKTPISEVKMYYDYHDDDGDGNSDYFINLTDFFGGIEQWEKKGQWRNVQQNTELYIVGKVTFGEVEILAIGTLNQEPNAYREKDSEYSDNADVTIVGFISYGMYNCYIGGDVPVSHYWEETENTKEVETNYHHYKYRSTVTLEPTNVREYLDESIKRTDDGDNFPRVGTPEEQANEQILYVFQNKEYFVRHLLEKNGEIKTPNGTLKNIPANKKKIEQYINLICSPTVNSHALFTVCYTALYKEEMNKEAERIMLDEKIQRYEIVREFGSNLASRFVNNILKDKVLVTKARYGFRSSGEYYDYPYEYIQIDLPTYYGKETETTPIYAPCSGMLEESNGVYGIIYVDDSDPECLKEFAIEIDPLVITDELKKKLEASDDGVYVPEGTLLGRTAFNYIEIGIFMLSDTNYTYYQEPSIYIDDECTTHYALADKTYETGVDELIAYFEDRLGYFWQDIYANNDDYPEKYNDMLGYNEVSFIYKALASEEFKYLPSVTDEEYGKLDKFKEALNGKSVDVSELKDGDIIIISETGECGFVVDVETKLMIHCQKNNIVKYEYFGQYSNDKISAYRVIPEKKTETEESEETT